MAGKRALTIRYNETSPWRQLVTERCVSSINSGASGLVRGIAPFGARIARNSQLLRGCVTKERGGLTRQGAGARRIYSHGELTELESLQQRSGGKALALINPLHLDFLPAISCSCGGVRLPRYALSGSVWSRGGWEPVLPGAAREPGSVHLQAVLDDLTVQCRARDTKDLAGLALVALGVVEHLLNMHRGDLIEALQH